MNTFLHNLYSRFKKSRFIDDISSIYRVWARSDTIQGFKDRFHEKKINIIVEISAIYQWKSDISTIVSTACRTCGDVVATAFKSRSIFFYFSACFRIYRRYFGQNIDGGGD